MKIKTPERLFKKETIRNFFDKGYYKEGLKEGKAQEQERIFKEINTFEGNLQMSMGIMFDELRSKIKGDEQ